MRWIGQHIWDFISRFRSDVYLEDLTESAQDHVVGIAADGKLYKQDTATGDITSVTAGTNCSGGGSSGDVTINVDDAFLINSGDDTTSGVITAGGFTTGTTVIDDDTITMTPSTSDTVTIAAATNGALNITTVDAAAAAANLTFTVDGATEIDSAGDVTLDAGSKQTYIKRGGADFINFNYNTGEYIQHAVFNANDVFKINVGAEGATTISTTDADTSVGHISIIPDGGLYLDPLNRTVDIGADTDVSFVVQRRTHSDGNGGDLDVKGGSATSGVVNMAGGNLSFYTGNQTGNATPGKLKFYSTLVNIGSDGTLRSSNLISELYTGISTTEQRWYEAGGASANDYFKINVAANGATTLSTVDGGGTNANLTLDADGNIEINAEGGDVTFKDASAVLAKISTAGLSFVDNTGAGIVFEGSTDDAYNTTLTADDTTSSNKTITLPDTTGTVQLQGKTTGQYVQIPIKDIGTYMFYLYNDDSWYSAGSTTLALLGSSTAPGNLSSANSEYQGRISAYVAPAACTLQSLTFTFYWSSTVVNAADFDFGFSKHTSITDGTAAEITMNAIAATDCNGSYTEAKPYSKVFTFSGGNATFAAGDCFSFHMRTTGGSSAQRVLVYGVATLDLVMS